MASSNPTSSGDNDVDESHRAVAEHKDKIDELRKKFFEENSSDDPDSPYDPRDIEWICSCDAYMYHVLLIGRMDLDIALQKLDKILKWRKEFGVNDLTFESFPEEHQRRGSLFPHTTDKEDHRILWFRVKDYQKDPENQMLAKKMTVYWLNRLQKEDPYHRIVVLEDMNGASVTNMDLELIRFKIQCFELYFPALVHMLYIYDMAWILNTLWKVVEKILSQQAREHIRFIRGKEVQKYIDLDSLPPHMGGTDMYEFAFIPEKEVSGETDDVEENEETDGDGDVTFGSTDGDIDRSLLPLTNGAPSSRQPKHAKKVHFQDDVGGKENVAPEHSSHRRHRKLAGSSRKGRSKELHVGPLVSIRPGDVLLFKPPSSISGSEGISANLTITNTTERKVVYKVKTTTPERYKVRPSMGPINPASSIHITITLLSGPGETVVRDKFLILSSHPVDGESFKTANDIAQFWRDVRPQDKVEQRMSCMFSPLNSPHEAADQSEKYFQSILNKLKVMETEIAELRKQNSRLVWLQSLLLLAVILILVYLCFFRPSETILLTHGGNAQSSSCAPPSQKFLRGAREGL